ncbi:anti-sigma factor [soil metagenome]
MNLPGDDQLVHALVDDQLDLKTRLDLEARLADDAQLRQTVDGLRDLQGQVRAGADYHRAPDALRRRLSAMAQEPGRPAPSRWSPRAPALALAGLCMTVLIAVNVVWLRESDTRRLRSEVIASHVRSSLSEHLTDVTSSDHHTVKPWLSSKLDFSPPVAELNLPGSTFLGGRVDYLDGHPVAALVYRQGTHVVTAFMWPSTERASDPDLSNDRGFQIAHWVQGGMNHWTISDVDRIEFGRVVKAMQQSE